MLIFTCLLIVYTIQRTPFLLQQKKTELNIDILPHKDAFYAFASRADPDQAALVRAA